MTSLIRKIKIIVVVCLCLLFSGCKNGAPEVPQLKKFYAVLMGQKGEAICVEYDIITMHPFTIANASYLKIDYCNGVSGFKPEDQKKLLNWIDDISTWAKAQGFE